MIEFHLDSRLGVSPYQQIVQQVRHALRLGMLEPGDQLPTVKDVVASLAFVRWVPALPAWSEMACGAPHHQLPCFGVASPSFAARRCYLRPSTGTTARGRPRCSGAWPGQP